MGLIEDKRPSVFPERPGVKLELFCGVLSYQQHHSPILILPNEEMFSLTVYSPCFHSKQQNTRGTKIKSTSNALW